MSPAHYNPAVSFAALLTGKLRRRQTVSYVLTQLAGGALAALLVRALVGPATPAVLASDWKILVGELIFTLALAFVVLNVTSTRPRRETPSTAWRSASRSPRSLCRWQDDRRGVQSRRGVGWQRHRSADVEPFVDLRRGQPTWWSRRCRPLRLLHPIPPRS